MLAEPLWAEWKVAGGDALGLVLAATDTPTLQRMLAEHGGDFGVLTNPADVATQALDNLDKGPTWSFGVSDPNGPSPLGQLRRREAVELLSAGTRALYSTS